MEGYCMQYANSQLNGQGMLTNQQQADYAFRKNIDLQVDLARENLKFQHDLQREAVKNENLERRLDGIEKRRLLRENAAYAVISDSRKKLCLETVFPDGNVEISKPILQGTNFQMFRLVGGETQHYVNVVAWDEMEEPLVLEEDAGAKEFSCGMIKHGVPFCVGHDRKHRIAELVFGFLIRHSKLIMVGDHLGWNQNGDEWKWIDEEEDTLCEWMKRVE